MNVAIDKVLYHLTGNGNINTVTVAELERVTTEHPYFSIGQLLLAHKQNISNSPDFLPQIQKTALYITNSLWLQYQLQTEEPQVKLPITVEEETKPLLHRVVEEENKIQIPSVEKVKQIMDGIDIKPAPVVDETLEPQETIDAPVQFPQPLPAEIADHTKNEIAVEEHVNNEQQTTVADEAVNESLRRNEEEINQDNEPYTNKLSADAEPPENEEKQQEIPANKIPLTEEFPDVPEEDCAGEPYPETTEEVIHLMEIDEKQRNVIASVLDEQVAEFKKPLTAETPLPLPSEPYHTVDYFASQGIKLNLDLKSQDKLTNQLRKFTDWLKEMKSIPPNTDDLGTDPELEGAIHNIANTSNVAKEIVTETMAEVLVKQGKTDKAIQLYIKLSFLNPDKSAYFVKKIQKLKGI